MYKISEQCCLYLSIKNLSFSFVCKTSNASNQIQSLYAYWNLIRKNPYVWSYCEVNLVLIQKSYQVQGTDL